MNFNRLKNYLSDGATLSASYPKGWTSAVVADNENPNCIVHKYGRENDKEIAGGLRDERHAREQRTIWASQLQSK